MLLDFKNVLKKRNFNETVKWNGLNPGIFEKKQGGLNEKSAMGASTKQLAGGLEDRRAGPAYLPLFQIAKLI